MSSSLGFIADNSDNIMLALMVISFLLLLLVAYLYLGMKEIKEKTGVLFAGKRAGDLEEIILGQIEQGKRLEGAIAQLKQADQRILGQLAYAVQKVGVVRFNPFSEVGGNQSFAIALLDNYHSGVIILSLYSRDGVRIYAKPVKEGKSEYQLSHEEQEALELAMKR